MERIHKVYSIERETSKGTYVVRGETDKSSSDIQARSFMARTLERNGKECWAIEKPKLDKARRLRGIYFIDPEDKEFKEAIKNARKKLETPMAPAMPCKTCKKSKHRETRDKTPMRSNQNLRVSWKPVNPQECVWKNFYQIILRTILQERETIHCNITIWYTNFSYASSNEDTRRKSSSGQRMGKIGENFGVELDERQK